MSVTLCLSCQVSCCVHDTPNEAGNALDSETPGRSEGVQQFRVRCAIFKMLHSIVSEKFCQHMPSYQVLRRYEHFNINIVCSSV